MNRLPAMLLMCALMLSAMIGGCTASSDLTGTDRDQAAASAKPDTAAVVPPLVRPSAPPVQTMRQGFTTKDDTIEVESAQHNHKSLGASAVVPTHPAAARAMKGFSVQIGAFKDEANAAEAKQRLARRCKQTVTSQFDDTLKLYRVTVGTFTTEKAALRFAASLRKKYPREYAHAWVVRNSE